MATRPTPEIWLSRWPRIVSAISLMARSEIVVRGQRQRQHRSVGRIDLCIGRRIRQRLRQNAGGGVDRGLDVLGGAVDIALLRSNCSDIWLTPKELVDCIEDSDGICPSWRSSGAVISEAITSGLAPGSCVVT